MNVAALSLRSIGSDSRDRCGHGAEGVRSAAASSHRIVVASQAD
jgi:hypothetical protein